VPLTAPAFVSALSALLALGTGACVVGMLPLPRWRQHRWLLVLALGAAVYAACDIALTSTWSAAALIRVNHLRMTAAAVFCLAWIRYAEEDLGPLPGRAFRLVAAAIALATLVFWIPGAAFAGGVDVEPSPWPGVSYRFTDFTALGKLAASVLLLPVAIPVVRYARAAARGAEHAWPHFAAATLLLLAACNDLLGALLPQALYFPFLLDAAFMAGAFCKGLMLMRRWRADMAALSAELQSRVEQRSKELEQAMRALFRTERLAAVGRLASGVAHEINNPAAVVQGNLEYVLECRARGGPLPDDATEALTEARDGVRRIVDIVRKLLPGTKAARQEDLKGFSVAEAIGAAADRARAGLRPGVDLAVDLPADLPARGSAALVEQVLVDLARNAAEAIPEGRSGSVRISATRQADQVLVRVIDDGSGMDEPTVARLFEPFFSTRPVGQGMGLSLPVSLALLRSIGGDLRIDSEPGRGTTATVVLEAASATRAAA
jgi:signal transduction histidine kinase